MFEVSKSSDQPHCNQTVIFEFKSQADSGSVRKIEFVNGGIQLHVQVPQCADCHRPDSCPSIQQSSTFSLAVRGQYQHSNLQVSSSQKVSTGIQTQNFAVPRIIMQDNKPTDQSNSMLANLFKAIDQNESPFQQPSSFRPMEIDPRPAYSQDSDSSHVFDPNGSPSLNQYDPNQRKSSRIQYLPKQQKRNQNEVEIESKKKQQVITKPQPKKAQPKYSKKDLKPSQDPSKPNKTHESESSLSDASMSEDSDTLVVQERDFKCYASNKQKPVKAEKKDQTIAESQVPEEDINQKVAAATQSITKIVSRSGRTVKKNKMKGEDSEDAFLRDNQAIGANIDSQGGYTYHCKFCFKKFKQCAALGGHISKAHPGQSLAYNHKKKVREQRELERVLHRDSMRVYMKMNDLKSIDSKNLNRNTLRRLKKQLVAEKDDYIILRQKFLGMRTKARLQAMEKGENGEEIKFDEDADDEDGESQQFDDEDMSYSLASIGESVDVNSKKEAQTAKVSLESQTQAQSSAITDKDIKDEVQVDGNSDENESKLAEDQAVEQVVDS